MKLRKRLSVEKKIEILSAHFKKAPVSATSAEFDIHPNQLNQWMKTILENGAECLNGRGRVNQRAEEARFNSLQNKLSQKDDVIAELAAEVIRLKKSNGETLQENGSPRKQKKTF